MTDRDFLVSLEVNDGDRITRIRQFPDGDKRHEVATALTRAVLTVAETFNNRDLDRIADAVRRAHSAIFADDRKAAESLPVAEAKEA